MDRRLKYNWLTSKEWPLPKPVLVQDMGNKVVKVIFLDEPDRKPMHLAPETDSNYHFDFKFAQAMRARSRMHDESIGMFRHIYKMQLVDKRVFVDKKQRIKNQDKELEHKALAAKYMSELP